MLPLRNISFTVELGFGLKHAGDMTALPMRERERERRDKIQERRDKRQESREKREERERFGVEKMKKREELYK